MSITNTASTTALRGGSSSSNNPCLGNGTIIQQNVNGTIFLTCSGVVASKSMSDADKITLGIGLGIPGLAFLVAWIAIMQLCCFRGCTCKKQRKPQKKSHKASNQVADITLREVVVVPDLPLRTKEKPKLIEMRIHIRKMMPRKAYHNFTHNQLTERLKEQLQKISEGPESSSHLRELHAYATEKEFWGIKEQIEGLGVTKRPLHGTEV